MNLEIVNKLENDPQIESFIENSANGGIFHSPRFLGYHAPEKFSSIHHVHHHFVLRDHNEIIGFMPGMKIVENGIHIFKSPFGSSYGGLIHNKNLYYDDIDQMIFLIQESLAGGFQQSFITPPSEIYCTPKPEISNYQQFLWMKYGFRIHSADILMCSDTRIELDIQTSLHPKTRTELRQALKNNLTCEISENISEEDYRILEESQERLGTKPTHTFEELQRIMGLYPGRITIFKTKSGAQTIAGIICFAVSKSTLNTFYIFDHIEFRQLKPNHFGYYHVLKYAHQMGFKYVDFGPSSKGFNDNKPLIFFKEKFGNSPYIRYSLTR